MSYMNIINKLQKYILPSVGRGLGVGLLLFPLSLHAQVWDTLCIDRYRIDTVDVGALKAEVNALAFFQNNEFSSRVAKGYTLPGGWLQPKLTYTPIRQIRIEAGAHLMFYDGANRYPNYAYHDIVRWKGNQHTHGVHALPYLRAQTDFRHLTLVLGDLYGAQNHGLVLPLFNPEQNLSTDPEMGFQLLADHRHNHLDMWINWQSYIFNLDSHQEAFTVGVNNTILWNHDKDRRLQWETPVQLILQHRGGELDTTNAGVQTVMNAAIGVRMRYRPVRQRVLNHLRAEVNLLASWQQHGTLWPYDTGMGMHTSLQAQMLRGLDAELGYVCAPRRLANLYGSPFFGTLSTRYPGETFTRMHTLYASLGYTYVFTPAYRLGARLDVYSYNSRQTSSVPLAFGVYLRVCPSFVLKRR